MAEHFERAGHLPNQRPGGRPASSERLPRQRNGITPQMHGRYPDFNVMDQADHWDELTRELLVRRIEHPPPIRFFTDEEVTVLRAFADVVLDQDREPRIPVLEMVDAKLHEGRLDGFQHADMPDDRETWRRVAVGLGQAAAQHGAPSFAAASQDVRRTVVGAFARGELRNGVWEKLPCATAWSVVMRGLLSEFYSHPWAWNEIGFSGPAYPRGYARLGPGEREPWEAAPNYEVDPVTDVPDRGLES